MSREEMAKQRHTDGNGKESLAGVHSNEKSCVIQQKVKLRVKSAELGIRLPQA